MPRNEVQHEVQPITARFLAGWPLPVPEGGDKEARGCVLVVGGSPQMAGGAILAANAALRAGAGKLQVATAKSVAKHVAAHVPEAYVVAVPEAKNGSLTPAAVALVARQVRSAKAVVMGPGMVGERESGRLLKSLLERENDATWIVDAAPLAVLARDRGVLRGLRGRAVITPHAGEMSTITGLSKSDVERGSEEIARRIAGELECVVVLKGTRTFIASPDGVMLRNDAGNVGLGTSGSGDVLAGAIAGLAARSVAPLQAAAWGVYVHALAGERLAKSVGPVGYLARELPGEIPRLLAAASR